MQARCVLPRAVVSPSTRADMEAYNRWIDCQNAARDAAAAIAQATAGDGSLLVLASSAAPRPKPRRTCATPPAVRSPAKIHEILAYNAWIDCLRAAEAEAAAYEQEEIAARKPATVVVSTPTAASGPTLAEAPDRTAAAPITPAKSASAEAAQPAVVAATSGTKCPLPDAVSAAAGPQDITDYNHWIDCRKATNNPVEPIEIVTGPIKRATTPVKTPASGNTPRLERNGPSEQLEIQRDGMAQPNSAALPKFVRTQHLRRLRSARLIRKYRR